MAADIEKAFSSVIKDDLSSFFEQYLRQTKIPELEYKMQGNSLSFRFSNAVKNFKIPIEIAPNLTIWPESEWKTTEIEKNKLYLDPQYLIKYKKIDN